MHSCLPKRKEVVTCSYHVIRKRCLRVVTDHVGLTLLYFIQRKPLHPRRVRTAVYMTHITPKNIDVYIYIMERDTMFAFQGFSPKSYDKFALVSQLSFLFGKIQSTLKNQFWGSVWHMRMMGKWFQNWHDQTTVPELPTQCCQLFAFFFLSLLAKMFSDFCLGQFWATLNVK